MSAGVGEKKIIYRRGSGGIDPLRMLSVTGFEAQPPHQEGSVPHTSYKKSELEMIGPRKFVHLFRD